MNRRQTLSLIGGAAAALLPKGAPAAPEGAADLLRALHAESGAPGAGIALWDGAEAHIAVSGMRAADAPAQIEPGDLWHVGSNTKSMTAFMIARLVEAGRLSWHNRIGDLLGDAVPRMRLAYKMRTLHDLLTHRAGVAANPSTLRLLRFVADERPATLQYRDLARHILARAPEESGPPFGFAYSNAGYVIAAAMAEEATGETWEALMRRHVFGPLDMASAGFGPPPEGNPQGHNSRSRPQGFGFGADNPPVLWPAGAVHLSLADHLAYLRAYLDRPALLRRANWQRLMAPVGEYACGWGVMDGRIWGHSGSNTMWLSHVAFCPGTGRAAVANMNIFPKTGARTALGRLNDWVGGAAL